MLPAARLVETVESFSNTIKTLQKEYQNYYTDFDIHAYGTPGAFYTLPHILSHGNDRTLLHSKLPKLII